MPQEKVSQDTEGRTGHGSLAAHLTAPLMDFNLAKDIAQRRTGRNSKTQLRVIVASPAPLIKLTDTSGNPSESFDREHMAEVRREWQHEIRHPYVNRFELTLAEITNIETQVRSELYP